MRYAVTDERCPRLNENLMEESHAWDLYFLTVVGWLSHPGYAKGKENYVVDLDAAAETADKMLEIRREKWPSGYKQ